MVSKRDMTIDILKGLACITVVLIHVFRGEGMIETFIGEFGRWAVPAFFMVQGFYLHRATQKPWIELTFKRIKRIYLPFILYSAAYGVYFYLFDGKEFTLFDIAFGKTAVHLYYVIHYMVFALCLPLLYQLPKRYRNYCLLFMILSNFIICLALEIQRAYGIQLITYSGFNPTKWWGFVALGMLAADYQQFSRMLKKYRSIIILISTILVVFGTMWPFCMNRIGYMYNRSSLFPLSIGMTLLIVTFFVKENVLGRDILVYISQRCFGIYLLHFFIVHILKYIVGLKILWLVAILTMILSLFVLDLSSKVKKGSISQLFKIGHAFSSHHSS